MDHVVSLSGGNALGAFYGGAVQTLMAQGIAPVHVAGTSIGALTAGLWLGGPADSAVERIAAFWQHAVDRAGFGASTVWRKSAVARALFVGRPSLFHPTLPGVLSAFPGAVPDNHLFDTAPLRRLLRRLIDVDALNAGPTRLSVVTLDQTTGESIVFDNRRGRIEIEHLLASASLPLAFPPVKAEGRMLVDAGLSENCPVRQLFDPMPTRPTCCWVLDPWPRHGPPAVSLDEVLGRTQDLAFACQRGWALEDVRRACRLADAAVDVREVLYDDDDWEIGGKAFDYTQAALQRRWAAGRAQMAAALSLAKL